MKKLWEKLKKIKNIEIYAAVVVVIIIIIIYCSTLVTPKQSTANDSGAAVSAVTQTYADMIESKLAEVIGSIKGAGHVAVMVMTDGEGTSELAYNIDEKTVEQTGTSGQGTTTTTSTKTLLLGTGGKPIVLWINPPDIIGIIVVATGAADVGVRLNILKAVQTIIGSSNAHIEILTGN